MKYWTQVQRPEGGWVDSLGTESLETASQFAADQRKNYKRIARVVARTDVVMESESGTRLEEAQ